MARVGAARVFFDIVGTFQAGRLLKDAKQKSAVLQAIMLDAVGGIAEGFEQLFTAITDGVDSVVTDFFEFEEQLRRVRKFYNDSAAEVDRFADSAKNLGIQFGFTGAEALKASARSAQLKEILGEQEAVIAATRAGLLMAAVGEMETEIAMTRFINLAQQTQFLLGGVSRATFEMMDAQQQANIVYTNSIRVLDQLNTVENTSVATMEDITFVLNQFAAQAHLAGESVGEMAAKAALLLETGEEVSRAGTGLRMIYQRLGNANNQATKAIAANIEGIEAQDVAMMSLTTVLEKLTPSYDTMTASEKRALAVDVAGSRHYIKFLKLMENRVRLTELQTNAYRAQYGALEEFRVFQESAVFQAQQAEAAITNLSASIGEKLAPAYIKAYNTQYAFLSLMEKSLSSGMMTNIVGTTYTISKGYEHMIKPFMEMGLLVGNAIIAYKTMNAVMSAQRGMTMAQSISYEAQAAAANSVYFAEHRLVQLTQKRSLVSKVALETDMRASMGVVGNLQKQINFNETLVQKTAARVAHANREVQAGRINMDQALARVAKAHQEEGIAQKKLSILIPTIALKRQEMDMERGIYNAKVAQLPLMAELYKKPIADRMELLSTQKAYEQTLRQEQELMTQKHLLVAALSAEQRKALEIRLAEMHTQVADNETRLSAINLMILEKEINRESTVLLEKKRDSTLKIIAADHQRIQQIEALVHSSTLHTAALYQEIVVIEVLTKKQRVWNYTMAASAAQIKGMMRGMKGMLFILPFVVDSQDQMKATTFALGTAFIAMGIKAMWTSKAVMSMTGVMKVARMAALALQATIGGLVLFMAYKFVESTGLLDGLATDIAAVSELNAGLIDTKTLINEITQKRAGDEMLMEGGLGAEIGIEGISYRDISTDAVKAAEVHAALANKITSLGKDITMAENEGQTARASALKNARDSYKDVFGEIEQIHTAHIDRTELMTQDYSDIQVRGIEYETDGMRSSIRAGAYDIFGIDAFKYEEGFTAFAYRLDETGQIVKVETAEWRDTNEEMQMDITYLTRKYSDENRNVLLAYYDDILGYNDTYNTSVEDNFKDHSQQIIADMESFANNREELFWGSRENFTGALYKQVTQGGVENLLHKVEIMQTNNFYGLTVDEAIAQITSSIMTQLRIEGVVA